jgi:hypothetical protein
MGIVNNKEQTMWYVYDKDTTVIQKTLKTRGAAKAWITRKQRDFLANQGLYVSNDGPLFDWGYAEAKYFHEHIERQVRKINLMTGEAFVQPANTPRSCDPSTETYWSM